jgi:hypothetical protein
MTATSTPQPQAPPVQAAQAKTNAPIFKKWWFWVIIVVVLVGIGGAIENGNRGNSGETVGSAQEQAQTSTETTGNTGSTASGSSTNQAPSSSTTTTSVAVPNVVGMTGDQAESAIKNSGLKHNFTSDSGKSVIVSGNWIVIDQSPAPGSEIPSGSTVELLVQDSEQYKQSNAQPELSVDAGTLIAEYEQNELAADDTYKGKIIAVTGIVNKIDTELLDSDAYLLSLGTGGQYEFFFVNCYDISNDALRSVTPGSTVTVIGEVQDGGDAGVTMRLCRIG